MQFDLREVSTLNIKTLDRSNNLIDFFSFSQNKLTFQNLNFKFIIFKFSSISNLSFLNENYQISNTTIFYHYFFKVEVLKKDYYQIQITNQFSYFFKLKEFDKLLYLNYLNQISVDIIYLAENIRFGYVKNIYLDNFIKYSIDVVYENHIPIGCNVYIDILDFNFPKTFFLKFQIYYAHYNVIYSLSNPIIYSALHPFTAKLI